MTVVGLVGVLWIIVLHFIHKVCTRVFVCNAYTKHKRNDALVTKRGGERETESKMCKKLWLLFRISFSSIAIAEGMSSSGK